MYVQQAHTEGLSAIVLQDGEEAVDRDFEREFILGTGITLVSPGGAADFCERIFSGGSLLGGAVKIYTPNPEIIMKADKASDYRDVLNRGALVVPDGIGVVMASKLRGGAVRERITGVGLLEQLLGFAEKYERGVYLLGSKPGVADDAAVRMKEKFPKLKIVGTHHGYFGDDEESVVEAIAAAKPYFLVVALGAPKQEFFIDKYAESVGASVAIGVGGALDVWAGNVKRAPRFVSRIGMEWLYRALSQPSRIPRLAAIPKFIIKTAFTRR